VSAPPELFHAVADPASAEARRRVSDWGLLERVRFRNVFYPEVQADFAARGGRETPALWDGQTLSEGLEAVLAALTKLRPTSEDG
jgi:hypothetical protein